MPSTEPEVVGTEKVNMTSEMESCSNSNSDKSFVHLGRVLVNLMPEKEKTIFGTDHSVTMQLYRLHQVPEYLHIKPSLTNDNNNSIKLTNNVKWYTPWNWWRLFSSSPEMPSTSLSTQKTNNVHMTQQNIDKLQYNRADQTKSTAKVSELLQGANGEESEIESLVKEAEEEMERNRMLTEVDEMYDELNEIYLTNPDLHHSNKESIKGTINDNTKMNKKKTITKEEDETHETLSNVADEKTRSSFASSKLEKELITKERQQSQQQKEEKDNLKSINEEGNTEKQHKRTLESESKQNAKKRRQLPEIAIEPLTDEQVEEELTEAVRNDRTQMLHAEEQIHTILSNIEKTRMRYLVPSTLLKCEEKLNLVTKCYEAFNTRKRSELMANMNNIHNNNYNQSDTSRNSYSNNQSEIKTSVKSQTVTQAELLKCAPLAKSLRCCVDLTLSTFSGEDDTENNFNSHIEDDKENNDKVNVNNVTN